MMSELTPVITSACEDNILRWCDGFLRRKAVDHVGVSHQNQVQPPTAPPPARRHTELSASGL